MSIMLHLLQRINRWNIDILNTSFNIMGKNNSCPAKTVLCGKEKLDQLNSLLMQLKDYLNIIQYNSVRRQLFQISEKAKGYFRIGVVGTLKSGKSTFINAMIGQELLPVDAMPETSNIVIVRHSPTAEKPVLYEAIKAQENFENKDMLYFGETKEIAKGLDEVYNTLKKLNISSREKPSETINYYLIEVCMQAFKDCKEDSVIELIDNPGFNEIREDNPAEEEAAINPKYLEAISKLASLCNMMITLVPYVANEQDHSLKIINEISKVSLARGLNSLESLWLVYNKCDGIIEENDKN